MRIFINGKERRFYEPHLSLSFENMIFIADLPKADTVTYSKAWGPGEQGTLLPGERVTVKEGTIVNVTSTGNA